MRLIDASVVETELWNARRRCQMMDDSQTADKIMHGLHMAEQIMKNTPTVEAVRVVRCKYCYAYRKDKELARAADLDEEQYCALLQCEMPEYGYCYYGSQKGTRGENDALN